MFIRTERLLLRPGFLEDAPELTAAINDEAIARNLARLPWPYTEADAAEFLSQPQGLHTPQLLIIQRTHGVPRLVGGIGIQQCKDGDDGAGGTPAYELGYWIRRSHWGLGFATEAGRALIRYARAIHLPRLTACHFTDNPSSGAVLRKLGFRSNGRVAPRTSLYRGEATPAALYTLEDGAAEEGAVARCAMRNALPMDEDFLRSIRLQAA